MRTNNPKSTSTPVISAHLDAIFNAVIDGVIVIDDKGIIQAVNPAACILFGYKIKEIMGNNVKMLMDAPHHAKHNGYINNYKRTGKKKIIGIGREVEGKRKDGSSFPFRLSISESIIDGKKFFTGIVHDITEIKQAHEELALVNKQLEKIVGERTTELTSTVNKLLKSNALLKEEISLRQKTELDLEKALEKEKELGMLKTQFVTMASHEFRTPLSTILSSANIIGRYKETIEQPKREKHIQKISSSVKNMTNILEDILSLGQLEEGKIDNLVEDFEIIEFVKEVLERLKTILKEGQHIDVSWNPKKINVKWAKNLTENILNNLLSNAIKYSGEHSRILLEIEKKGKKVTIRITDEGIGIPPDHQKHLFRRFFRAPNVMNIKGTGLGLHIVQQYLTLMNGEIEFSSVEGKGSVFSTHIPITYSS